MIKIILPSCLTSAINTLKNPILVVKTELNMKKGIPRIKRIPLIRSSPFMTGAIVCEKQFISAFEADKYISLKDIGHYHSGFLFVQKGAVILTVGNSVTEVKSGEVAIIEQGYQVNLKMEVPSSGVFIENP